MKRILWLLLLPILCAATPLTYNSFNTPYAAPYVKIYLVWYGAWTDTATQAVVADMVANSLSVLPSVQISKLYPVGLTKNVSLQGTFQLAGQISVPYSSAYSGGVSNQFLQGSGGEGALVGSLITAGTIPTPTENANEETDTYVIILLGSGITSSSVGACAYTDFAGNDYMVSVILDQSNNLSEQSCSGYVPLNNHVSGTVTSDLDVFAITAEATHAIQAAAWNQSGTSISELCLSATDTIHTAPSNVCTGTNVCQYTVTVNPDGTQRYYYLSETYVQMPPGSHTGQCQADYMPFPSSASVAGNTSSTGKGGL